MDSSLVGRPTIVRLVVESLERPCLAWNAPRFFTEARRRRAEAAPEEPREMALIREAGRGSDLRDRPFVAGDLRRSPVEPKAATILPDGDPVPGTEHPGEVRGVHAYGVRQLAQAEGVTDAGPKKLLGGVEPPRRTPEPTLDRRLASRGREDLESQALGRQRRGRIRCPQLGGQPP